MITRTKRILIAISIMILLASTVNAYVPKEYQTGPYMSTYDVYKVSTQHIGEKWADRNLDDLMNHYGRIRCLPCLDAAMERMKINEEKNSPRPIIKVQKLPTITKK